MIDTVMLNSLCRRKFNQKPRRKIITSNVYFVFSTERVAWKMMQEVMEMMGTKYVMHMYINSDKMFKKCIFSKDKACVMRDSNTGESLDGNV
jgi:hypothetical protein